MRSRRWCNWSSEKIIDSSKPLAGERLPRFPGLRVYWRVLCNIAGKMPAARGTKRTASKIAAVTASSAPKSKKKRGGQYSYRLIHVVFFAVVRRQWPVKRDGGKRDAFSQCYWRLFSFIPAWGQVIYVSISFRTRNAVNCCRGFDICR